MTEPKPELPKPLLKPNFKAQFCVMILMMTSTKFHLILVLEIHGRVSRSKTMRDPDRLIWKHFEAIQ